MAYTTQAQVQNYLAQTIAAGETARVAAFIADAQAQIDALLGTTWTVPASATQRRFEGNGLAALPIDPCTSITSVVLCVPDYDDETLVDGTDWVPLPAGSAGTYRPEAATALHRLSDAVWTDSPAYVKVTAKWADAALVPADIALACAYIVAAKCRSVGVGTEAEAGVKSESWGDYSKTYGDAAKTDSLLSVPPEAQQILDRYRDQLSDGPWVEGVGPTWPLVTDTTDEFL